MRDTVGLQLQHTQRPGDQRQTQTIQVARGIRATKVATRRPQPAQALGSGHCVFVFVFRSGRMGVVTGRGTMGQKALRPVNSRTAGRKVSAASTANTMPMAAMGPGCGWSSGRKQQAQQRQDHGGSGSGNWFDRTPVGGLHRRPTSTPATPALPQYRAVSSKA